MSIYLFICSHVIISCYWKLNPSTVTWSVCAHGEKLYDTVCPHLYSAAVETFRSAIAKVFFQIWSCLSVPLSLLLPCLSLYQDQREREAGIALSFSRQHRWRLMGDFAFSFSLSPFCLSLTKEFVTHRWILSYEWYFIYTVSLYIVIYIYICIYREGERERESMDTYLQYIYSMFTFTFMHLADSFMFIGKCNNANRLAVRCRCRG